MRITVQETGNKWALGNTSSVGLDFASKSSLCISFNSADSPFSPTSSRTNLSR
ncbi:hypothetical protein P170DRAFT_440583 [Aspergillus steynii IBT 23096]|uniref:Uncharacterized protein n=1 Tax=Aspergillus steynii IBT 23096 TaxID=1392250 RepID=A0A2I2FUI8_9EURO|nr:uncharacterized protein P170DRAFT_440583 [Aspergillus steynii IBT 23096]PLB44271.1 hypothetical protein P170DRAFT_440583 [Aspergillus steynii IBT 23096]